MKKIRNCLLTSLALFACGVTASAQDAVSRETSRAVGPAVTISVTERGVRFAALGSFGKMRLEVFNADGASLYNSDFAAASVRDWVLDNKDGLLLPDGTYLCVITIRDLSGRLSTKQGSVVLQGGQPSLKLPDGESVEVVEPDKSLARVTNPPDNALTLIGHDGKNGQLVSTRGALTFRFGDFFGGKDKELMRLTPEGNLGLGVKSPQAKLDVAGTIRANGIEFANGTTQTTGLSGRVDAQGNIIPAASGTGTQNRVAKWTDNSGTLGDSVITESSGKVGIGTAGPGGKLEVVGAPTDQTIVASVASTAAGQARKFSLKSSYDATSAVFDAARITVYGSTGGYGNSSNYVGFDTAIGGDLWSTKMAMTLAGNVGIGTTNPGAKLDVDGNLNITGNATISGNIAAKYQDIAEWTSARSQLSSGTVVSLDTLR